MKKYLSKFLLALSFVVCLSFAACSDEDKVPDELVVKQESSFTGNCAKVSCDNCELVLAFETNTNWSLDFGFSNWLSSSSLSGRAGLYSVSIKVGANDTYVDRTATIELIAGEIKKVFSVSQSAKGMLTVDAKEVELDYDQTSFSIVLNANIDVYAESKSDWVTLEYVDKSKAVFKTSVNLDFAQRECEVRLYADNGMESVVAVRQAALEYLNVDAESIELSSDNSGLKISVDTNAEVEVITSVPWIEYASVEEGKYSFEVSQSDEYGVREGVVTFRTAKGKEASVVVKQMGRTIFTLISTNEVKLRPQESTYVISYEANFNFSLSQKLPEWLAVTFEDPNYVIVSAQANNEFEERTYSFEISDPNKTVTETINVTQQGAWWRVSNPVINLLVGQTATLDIEFNPAIEGQYELAKSGESAVFYLDHSIEAVAKGRTVLYAYYGEQYHQIGEVNVEDPRSYFFWSLQFGGDYSYSSTICNTFIDKTVSLDGYFIYDAGYTCLLQGEGIGVKLAPKSEYRVGFKGSSDMVNAYQPTIRWFITIDGIQYKIDQKYMEMR